MKRVLISMLFTGLTCLAYGQKWKEKLKEAGEKVKSTTESVYGIDNKDYSSEYEGKEFPDMMTYLEDWEGKKVKSYTRNDAVFSADYKTVEIKFIKEGDEFKFVEIGDWKYAPIKAADSDKIKSFRSTPGALYMNEENIAVYQLNSNDEVFIRYLYGAKQSVQKMTAEIQYYNAYTQGLIDGDVAAATEKRRIQAEKDAAERKAKFGLHDKKVKSIKVISSLPPVNGHFVAYDYSIEATLEDGTKINTDEGGFIDDYIITDTPRDFENKITKGFIPGDEIVIKAALKYDKTITAEKRMPLDYNTGAGFPLFGRYRSRSSGDDGSDVEIEIWQENHAVTGKPVLRVHLTTNAAHIDGPIDFSIDPSENIEIHTYGGGGGDDNGYYNGGDGGDITVYKDPSVTSFRIKYKMHGGKPGGGISASPGRDGTYREIEQKLK